MNVGDYATVYDWLPQCFLLDVLRFSSTKLQHIGKSTFNPEI